MRHITNGTGINSFSPGQSLSSQDMNNINTAVNSNSRVVNDFLREYINPNVEENNFTKRYTLETVLPKVPGERRYPGVKLRFLGESGWEEYIFASMDPNDWNKTWKWKAGDQATIIDGGEW